MKYLIYYLIIINLFTIRFMYLDKNRAKRGSWRIKERTLYLLTALGGGIGMLFSMKVFRHKVSKNSFKLVVYTILMCQTFLLLYFIYRG